MKKSRKKMLLSSIAMLLVAILALSAATFAWFTVNKTVTAQGFNAKAASSIGLKVLSATEAASKATGSQNAADVYSDKANYGYSTTIDTANTFSTMAPVSLNTTGTSPAAYKTTAADAKASTAKATAEVEDAVAGTDYYSENIYVVLDGNTSETAATEAIKVQSLTVNQTNAGNAAQKAGVRVALYYYDGTDNKFVGAYAPTETAGKAITAKGATYQASTVSDYTFKAFSTVNATTTANTGTVGETAGQCYFTVVAYLDGEDANVKSSNISVNDLIDNIEVKFTIA